MAASTVKLTAAMEYQDGTPFDGFLSVRLNSASRTDEVLVGPYADQKVRFENGRASVDLYPNSALEEGTYYRAKAFTETVENGYRSKRTLFETAFVMPDEDSFLHDLATIEPVAVTDVDAVQLLVSQASEAASSAAESAASIAPLSSQDVAEIFGELA